jgi:RNA polymerase sigma factor (sigma-70 family)
MKEKILSSVSVHKYISNNVNANLFDDYLSKYQEDMVKIVGKYRYANHAMSAEEVISEANLLLIKGKNKILEELQDDFNEVNFKKMAFAYVKNAISWTNYAERNSKDARNLADGVHESEDGPKTTFELAIDTQGVEDEVDLFSNTESLKQFLHVLTQYSYILTENETKLISYLQKGLSQDQISEKLGVTHQAISFCFVNLRKKIKSQFRFGEIMSEKRNAGEKAMAKFFKQTKVKMLDKDKEKLRSFVKSNPKSYNVRQLNKILFKSKYSNRQLSAFLVKNKLYFLLNRV